jgi:hypothetical protein
MYRVLMCAALAGILSVPAKADETLRFRYVGHPASPVQRHEAGDVAGHLVGLFELKGTAIFPEETTAPSILYAHEPPGVVYWTGTFDYTNLNGPYVAYFTLTLRDKSVLWYKVTGKSAFGGKVFSSAGTVTVIGGKGRFEGAKGDGDVGQMLVESPEAGGDTFGEAVINLKK